MGMRVKAWLRGQWSQHSAPKRALAHTHTHVSRSEALEKKNGRGARTEGEAAGLRDEGVLEGYGGSGDGRELQK